MESSPVFVPGQGGSEERPELPVMASTRQEERARTLSLIDFLADYDARRNPPIYDIKRYDLFLLRDADLPAVPGVSLSPAGDAWMTVEFLDFPQWLEVPAELVDLLGDSATISPHVRPDVRTRPLGAEPDGPEPDPDPALVTAAEQWIMAVWEPFAARWADVAAAKALHRDLFEQRERLATDRESVELAWGFGRLRWKHDGELIDHPLISIPVEVEQDDVTQRLRVCPAGAPEVEARCLAGLSLADRAGFMSIRQSVNDNGTDLWDVQVLQGLLRPLIRAIDHDGTLVERASPPTDADAAVVDGSWVLFMRRRQPDYQGFLDRMRALYRDESVASAAAPCRRLYQTLPRPSPPRQPISMWVRRMTAPAPMPSRCCCRCRRMRSRSASWPRPSTAPGSRCKGHPEPASHTRSPTSSVTTSRTGNVCWLWLRKSKRCAL